MTSCSESFLYSQSIQNLSSINPCLESFLNLHMWVSANLEIYFLKFLNKKTDHIFPWVHLLFQGRLASVAHALKRYKEWDLAWEIYFNPNTVKCTESLSPCTVNYDVNFQICLWKRIKEVLVCINSSSRTRVLIKWSYFGLGYVLYDLLYIWFKSKFSITRISSLANARHLERVNLIFEDKNYVCMFPFHLNSFFNAEYDSILQLLQMANNEI